MTPIPISIHTPITTIHATHTRNIHRLNRRQIRKLGSSAINRACRKMHKQNIQPLTCVDDLTIVGEISSWIDNFSYGLTSAAKKQNISIVGGEMAQMPDTYRPGYVGVIVYIVGIKE